MYSCYKVYLHVFFLAEDERIGSFARGFTVSVPLEC